jgi:hypothetical protein
MGDLSSHYGVDASLNRDDLLAISTGKEALRLDALASAILQNRGAFIDPKKYLMESRRLRQ